MPAIANRINANPKLIQIGDSTHSHDQEITPHSFNTIKTIVSKPANPIPPLLLVVIVSLFFIFFSLYYSIYLHTSTSLIKFYPTLIFFPFCTIVFFNMQCPCPPSCKKIDRWKNYIPYCVKHFLVALLNLFFATFLLYFFIFAQPLWLFAQHAQRWSNSL